MTGHISAFHRFALHRPRQPRDRATERVMQARTPSGARIASRDDTMEAA